MESKEQEHLLSPLALSVLATSSFLGKVVFYVARIVGDCS